MPTPQTSYDFISNKLHGLKDTYPSLRTKTDEYAFSALCIKSNFFKNPAIELRDYQIEEMIVDGQYDGGVDALLTDPNSEASDLIICQSKYYSSINFDEVVSAVAKMVLFYRDMQQGHFEQVNAKVQHRFLSLNAEVGEESKIHFVLYTSAPQSGIRRDRVEKKFKDLIADTTNNVELSLLFGNDIEEEIKESESRRPTVEHGKITIDALNNYLLYGDDAAIVNVSAFSIKTLYAKHSTNLLARNLRFHIPGKDIDKAIEDTISTNPESFWLKNNGITIICDNFEIDGKEVKLRNFSIVNGGQTTYMLHKSKHINEDHDLFLPCKIITVVGDSEDEKNLFSLEIAKATNSQKAIKPVDLKANSPEQVRFGQAMREVGLFYQTKRGENVPSGFKDDYKNSDLVEIGKLCLAAVFQIPCASRAKPSLLYYPQYYEPVFNGNQGQISKLCKELLYIDFYFRTAFQKKFDRENENEPDSNVRISFAHNARTICVAFVAFAARYYQDNITREDLQVIFNYARSEGLQDSSLYDIFKNLDGVASFLPQGLFNQKDKYDEVLYQLFTTIINAGITNFVMATYADNTLNATNFLKKDKNYYRILQTQWTTISTSIKAIFSNIT